MRKLYDIFGIKWERPLKWYEYLLLVWLGLSFCCLAVDMDTIPLWAVALIVGNFGVSVWVGGKILPDIKDIDDEFSNELEE